MNDIEDAVGVVLGMYEDLEAENELLHAILHTVLAERAEPVTLSRAQFFDRPFKAVNLEWKIQDGDWGGDICVVTPIEKEAW